MCRPLPDEISGAGIGCGLLGGGSERALVLFAECIDGGVIVGGGGSAPLGSRLSADWLQAGAAKSEKWERFGAIAKITLHKASDLMHVTVEELLKWLPDHLACRTALSLRPVP